jgi:hypothetical protein
MDIVFFLLEFFLTVLFAGLRGELDVDDGAKVKKAPVPEAPEETLEFTECTSCGKPNAVDQFTCKACGALLQPIPSGAPNLKGGKP